MWGAVNTTLTNYMYGRMNTHPRCRREGGKKGGREGRREGGREEGREGGREGIKESKITKQREQKRMVMPLNLPQKLKGLPVGNNEE